VALLGIAQADGAQRYTYTSNPLTFDSARLYGRPYGSESDFPVPTFTVSYIIRDDGWMAAQSASGSGFDGDYSITPTWYGTDSFAFALAPIYHSRENRLSDQHFYIYHDPRPRRRQCSDCNLFSPKRRGMPTRLPRDTCNCLPANQRRRLRPMAR
jgi:hypothetical protein